MLVLWAIPSCFWAGHVGEVGLRKSLCVPHLGLELANLFCLSQVLGLQVSIIPPDYHVKNAEIACLFTLVDP